jgi:hypothetical protein
VTLGQRPEHATAPVDAADEGRDLGFTGSVEPVDDQAAGGGFVHSAQPFRPAARRTAPARFWGCRVGGLLTRRVFGRTGSTTAATPTPAPTWFGLFAVRHPSDSSWHGPVFPDILAGSPVRRRGGPSGELRSEPS